MDESLERAAREGNVRNLFELFKRDGNVLRRFGEVEFVDTPMHLAAEAGCISFAMEIMSLKPSLAGVLNSEGLSPLHIAVEKGHTKLVLNLIENAKDLVCVKGRNGETPLHYVIGREEKPELLPRFLEVCPDSVRDVTAENQTALHIAVIKNNMKALKIICYMLKKTEYCEDVVNQKDGNGDTALHKAASHYNREMFKLILKCKADKYVTNLDGFAALQLFDNARSRHSMIQCGSVLNRLPTFLQYQVLKRLKNAAGVIFQDMDNISIEDRNALLVILGLLLTATFQASLSPPGSVFQGDSSSNSTCGVDVFCTGHEGNVTTGHERDTSPGKSVMEETDFLLFYVPTCLVFMVTFFLTLGVLKPFPRGFKTALQILLAFLAICFFQSIHFLEPTKGAGGVISLFSMVILFLMTLMSISYRVSETSVLILGTWLFTRDDELWGHIGRSNSEYITVENILVVCWLLLFLYDELGRGIAVGVGYLLFLYFNIDWDPEMSFVSCLILGCWLFLFLHDKFWKVSFLLVGFCIISGVRSKLGLPYSMLILGCWLFLSLCRLCIMRCQLCIMRCLLCIMRCINVVASSPDECTVLMGLPDVSFLGSLYLNNVIFLVCDLFRFVSPS